MTSHMAVPQWVDLVIGLPVLVVIALAINYLCAIWLVPIVQVNGTKQTTSSLFFMLTGFSVLSAVFGALSAWWQISTIVALSILVLLVAKIAHLRKLQLTLCVVVAAICIPTFFIGHEAVEENTFIAFLLTIAGCAAVLFLGAFLVMLRMLERMLNP